jgi:hypothetical protein
MTPLSSKMPICCQEEPAGTPSHVASVRPGPERKPELCLNGIGNALLARWIQEKWEHLAAMEKLFHDWSKDAANRRADEWWGRQKGLRQTGRIEEHRGVKGPNAGNADWWVVTIQFESEKSD